MDAHCHDSLAVHAAVLIGTSLVGQTVLFPGKVDAHCHDSLAIYAAVLMGTSLVGQTLLFPGKESLETVARVL